MKRVLLTKDEDLTTFANHCGEKLNLHYPLEYLRRSKVRAFYNNDGAMVGGYILCFNGPFRVIESLPDHVFQNSAWTKSEVMDNTYEVTGLWLDKKVVSKVTNFLFWVTMYRDMTKNKKKYFVFAYDLDKEYLKKLYSVVNPEVIYAGKTKIMPGMKYACEESIEIASVNYIRYSVIYGWDYFAKKLILSRKHSNRYSVAIMSRALRSVFTVTPKLDINPEEKV